ncbi:nucleoside deaminase [Streptosporangium sp. G11]|uniref:nucleoside deaminase n=1 Tax=Streptosporangium sp. G11 TaxID=3436926 RepID=UPI003EBD2774
MSPPHAATPWRTVIAEAWRSYQNRGWGVGAAAVDSDGSVIEVAGNSCSSTAEHAEVLRHAEIEVLNRLTRPQRRTCIIYTTLEPCVLCLGALTFCRVPVVAFMARDFSFSAGWRHLRQAPILGSRVPTFRGPEQDVSATFARLLSMVAEMENGHGSGSFGLEQRMAPKLKRLADECVETSVFRRVHADEDGWETLLCELRPRLDSVTEELRRAEIRMNRLGML